MPKKARPKKTAGPKTRGGPKTAPSKRAGWAVPGIGPALQRRLARRGVRTRRGLRALAGELPPLARAHLRYPIARRLARAEAAALARALARGLRFGGRRVPLVVVGSLRRGDPAAKDVDLLAVAPDPAALGPPAAAGGGFELAAVVARGPRRLTLVVRLRGRGAPRPRYAMADVFVATPAERPYALFHFTGARAYNVRTRAHARRKGWRLNQYGLFDRATGRRAPGSAAVTTERGLARLLGVTYRPPADRGR